MEISSAPYLLDPIDFGLGNQATNKAKLQRFKKQYQSKVVGHYNGLELTEFLVSNKESYIITEQDEEITYLVHLQSEKLPALSSSSVTQVEVWRLLTSPETRGIAPYVFCKILLKRSRYIVSDSIQTEKGKDFWIAMLATCNKDGYRVGVIVEDDVTWSEHQTFQAWIRVMINTGWGKDDIHEKIRFVIGHN
jgi:hypothetical protein